jgi:hypothetical protein
MIFVMVFLALFSSNAKADLIGVDFGPVGQDTPTNWTSVSGAGTYNNLGTETGHSTAVGLQVTDLGGVPNSSAVGANVGTIPSHSNSLANIGGNIFRFGQQQTPELGLRIFNLEPSTSYDLWVFGLSDDYPLGQEVSGTIAFNQAALSQELVSNSTVGTSANDLSVYRVSATADGSGEINITVTADPDLYAVAGLAIDVPAVPPPFTKIFSPDTIVYGGTSTLTFTIDNSGSLADATSLDFTDNLPAGVTVANPANASTTCTGGTLTAGAGTGVISYTGGSLAAGGTCTLQADVTSTTAGTHNNTSGDLTSSLGNSGPASDSLTVGAEPIPTLNEWGVMVLAVSLGLGGFWFLRRRKPNLQL